MSGIKYRPEIDGLRAFAILPVILFHMGYKSIAGGGFIGVDVFFVISGFLITATIKRELEANTFSFRDFWARRIRRILPALLVMIVATLAFTNAFVFPPDRPKMGTQATFALLSVANFYYWENAGDYWGMQAEESPFLHCWSLSVEEQFYLFFPCCIWLIFRTRPNSLQTFVLIGTSISLLLFLFGIYSRPSATFYLLPTRAWELGTGAFLGLGQAKTKSPRGTLATLGLCMIIASYALLERLDSWLVIPVVGAAIVIQHGNVGFSNWLLSHAFFVHIGKVSYSLYLWHWPVLVMAERFGFTGPRVLLLLPIYVASILNYNVIEKPARRNSRALPAIMAGLLLTTGFAFFVSQASSNYYPDTTGFQPPHSNIRYYDLKPRSELSEAGKEIISLLDAPEREAPDNAYLQGGIIVGEGTPDVVVFGDSHGVMWSQAILDASNSLNLTTSLYSMAAVDPIITFPIRRDQKVQFLTPEEKFNFDNARVKFSKLWQPKIVVLCIRWAAADRKRTADFVKFLLTTCNRVLLVEQPPELAVVGNRNALSFACHRGFRPILKQKSFMRIGNMRAVDAGRDLIRSISDEYDRCEIVPTYNLYVQDDETLFIDGDQIIYADDDHLTTFGAGLSSNRFREALKSHIDTLTRKSK